MMLRVGYACIVPVCPGCVAVGHQLLSLHSPLLHSGPWQIGSVLRLLLRSQGVTSWHPAYTAPGRSGGLGGSTGEGVGAVMQGGLRERGNDTSRSTGRSRRQNAATPRSMRREERVTVQGPVKTH